MRYLYRDTTHGAQWGEITKEQALTMVRATYPSGSNFEKALSTDKPVPVACSVFYEGKSGQIKTEA